MTTTAQKTDLVAKAQALLDLVNSLTVDGDTVALEQQLSAVQADLAATTALRDGLQNKVNAAVVGLDAVRAGLVA